VRVRNLLPDDIPRLNELAKASGYPYPDAFSPFVEAALVVCDDEGNLIAAAAFEKIVQGYLWIDKGLGPVRSLATIRALHEPMSEALIRRGYTEANIFIPPKLEKNFGRHMERFFGWVKNWPSWAKQL